MCISAQFDDSRLWSFIVQKTRLQLSLQAVMKNKLADFKHQKGADISRDEKSLKISKATFQHFFKKRFYEKQWLVSLFIVESV